MGWCSSTCCPASWPQAGAQGERLQALTRKIGIPNSDAWASHLLGCLYLHSHELERAARHFAEAVEQPYALHTLGAIDALAGLALSRQLMDQPEEAAEAAGRLEEFARELNEPQYLAVAQSCLARLSLLKGEIAPALEWARSVRGAPAPMAVFLWTEVPWITRARVLIATGTEENLGEATERLAALRQQSEEYRFTGQVIEVSVLQALALERQGRVEEARKALKESAALAQPGGWIRPFVEAGPVMAGMLQRLRGKDPTEDFARRILAVSDNDGAAAPREAAGPTAPKLVPALVARTSPAGERRPLEDLTNRELDILELLAQRLQNKEIAERLSISPQTVNYHLKHIYEKLETSGRRQAVARAVELGILKAH